MTSPTRGRGDRAGPPRIGPLRSFSLRRRGRRDGAAGIPGLPADPERAVTTGERTRLAAICLARVARLWERYFESRAAVHTRLTELTATGAAASTAMERAQQELTDAGAAPTGATATATAAEQAHGRSPELVLLRRQRAHDQATRDVRARLAEAGATVERTATEITRLRREDAGRRYRVAVREHELLAAFLVERAIYDRALVRRHPARDELADALDQGAPPLTGWAGDALAAGPPDSDEPSG